MSTIHDDLAARLKDLDVPELRRDTTKPENVRWLQRNLFVRNKNAQVLLVLNDLQILEKHQRKEI